MRVIVLDPLLVAAGFLVLALSAWLITPRSRSWLTTLSVAAFGYCAAAQVAHFALTFIPDSSFTLLGNMLFVVSRLWPFAFFVAAIASLATTLRKVATAAP